MKSVAVFPFSSLHTRINVKFHPVKFIRIQFPFPLGLFVKNGPSPTSKPDALFHPNNQSCASHICHN